MQCGPVRVSLARLLACTILGAMMVTVASSWAVFTDQPCGTTTEGHSTGEDEVCGEASDADESVAMTFALFMRDAALGADSGVLCAFCPNEERCTRRGRPHGGSTSTNCEEVNGTWECESCYSGAYKVQCYSCPAPPPVPPGGG